VDFLAVTAFCVVAVEKRNWMKAVIDNFLLLFTIGFGNANLLFGMD